MPALKTNDQLAYYSQVDYARFTASLAAAELPYSDRLKVLIARIADWHVKVALSEAAKSLMNATGLLHAEGGKFYIWRSANGLTGKYILDRLAARLHCCGQRGTYYYAHVLLPHWPYVFRQDCSVQPAEAWRYNVVHEFGQKNTLKTRHERYRLYLQQVQCTQRVIARLVDSATANPALKDAIILVHGDHGSRIALADRNGLDKLGYDKWAYEMDQRGTLLAIRAPHLAIESVSAVVRLDDVLRALWVSDFASYDDAFTVTRNDQPYRPSAADSSIRQR